MVLKPAKTVKLCKLRKKLWPLEHNGKLICPDAPYTLSRREKDLMCKTLYHLKVPIGYGTNWRNIVSLENRDLKNVKSHDYHILMQQLLPVIMMYAFESQKPLHAAIRQLSKIGRASCRERV